MLPEDCRERYGALAFVLELERAECEFLTGALGVAEERLSMLSRRAANLVDQATVTRLRVDLYVTLGQAGRAIAIGLEYLRHLGGDWSPHPMDEEVQGEYERIWSLLGTRTVEELIDLPLMSDPASVGTLDVLTRVMPPAMWTDANLYFQVICRAVGLSIERGHSDGSCLAYAAFGMIAGPRFGDYQAGFRFGQLGYELVEQRGLKRLQAGTYLLFGGHVIPWARHIRASRDLLRRAFDAANATGDLTMAAFSREQLSKNLLAAGEPLVEAQRDAENALEFAQKLRFGFAIDLVTVQLKLIGALRGLTPKFGCFNDDYFDELKFEAHLAESPGFAIVECWYWIRKLQARFLAGDYASAFDASSRVQRLQSALSASVSQFETAEYHYYGALTYAASCDFRHGRAPPPAY